MKALWQALLVGICSSSFGTAQNRAPEGVRHELVLPDSEQNSEERVRARAMDLEFRQRMNHVAELFNALADEYTTKNAFNVRTARELSKAFRELERNECWPKAIPAK